MINHHSPAQLIAELRRLMDMDYERLPGARHVLEEAIAVIRPLAEKSAVGEMIDPLRALVAQWIDQADTLEAERNVRGQSDPDSDYCLNRRVAMETLRSCAKNLDALLSAPVVDYTNHHNALTCPYCNPDGLVLSAPVVSPPPPQGEEVVTCAHCHGNEGRLGYCWACYHELQDSYQRKHAEWVALLNASASRGGGETRPEPKP